jgi:hypothetical protein
MQHQPWFLLLGEDGSLGRMGPFTWGECRQKQAQYGQFPEVLKVECRRLVAFRFCGINGVGYACPVYEGDPLDPDRVAPLE